MKKLCLGTLLRILSDTKKANTKQVSFLNDLLSTVQRVDSYNDDKFQSALLTGKNNLSDYEKILTYDKKVLTHKFENIIKEYFDEDGQRLVIVCIQDVLKEDSLIKDTENIGFETEGFTKRDILSKQVFPFTEFLVNVYYYCTTAVTNRPYRENIKEIKNYTINQVHRINEVQLETKVSHVKSKVKLTLDPQPFNNIFKEVKTIQMSIPNHNELKIFRFDVVNSKIDYKRLHGFIAENIGRYIYSRGVRNNYNLQPDSLGLAIKTLKAYNKRVKDLPTTNHFNEIMLYSFLEGVLGAPKIFSKMELQDKRGIYDSFSSGVHIYTFKQGALFFNQLIFGATDTLDNLENAVDNALEQVLAINSAASDEYDFLENTILNRHFDPETNQALENLIIPKKSDKLSKPDHAYGLFLGYTVKTPDQPNNELFITDLESQMDSDIERISSYLEQKVSELELLNYSFYVYILPLNNAIYDVPSIMNDALKVDE